MKESIFSNGTLSFKGVAISTLPTNFSTPYSLDLNDSLIETLPEGLFVRGDLIIGNAKIESLPNGLYIGKNLIMLDKELAIPNDIIIGGKIVTKNNIIEPPFQKEHMIITDDNKKVVFQNTRTIKATMINDYYFPEVIFYNGIDLKQNAVQFTEEGNTHTLFCENEHDGLRRINWKRAEVMGLYSFSNYDIDEYRTVDELEKIYFTCTGACKKGIESFKKDKNINKDSLYTIRQLGEMVKNYDDGQLSKEVFLEFFKLN